MRLSEHDARQARTARKAEGYRTRDKNGE